MNDNDYENGYENDYDHDYVTGYDDEEEDRGGNKKRGVLITLIVVFGVILLCTGGYLLIKQLGIFSAGQTNRQVQESYAPDLQPSYHLTIPPTVNTEPPSQAAVYATESPTAPKPKERERERG